MTALAALPGCGTASPFSIQKAYGDTLGARTARLQLSATVSGMSPAPSGSVSLTGSGVVDLARQSFEMTLDLPAGKGQMRTVLSGGMFYMEPPPGLAIPGSGLPPGKTWLAINLSRLLGANGASFGPGVTSSDPTGFLQGLARSKSAQVTDLGPTDLRGIPCEHYRARIDLAQVARQASSDSTATLLTKELVSSLSQLAPATVEVWVDRSDQFRRAVETIGFPGGLKLAEQIDLSDFGVPATIEAPPTDEVFDASVSPWAGQVVFPGSAPGAVPTRAVPCPGTVINVFLDPNDTGPQIDSVRRRIEQDAPAARVVYIDQDQSYAEFRQLFSSDPTMVNSVTPADLPPSFRVVPDDPGRAQGLISDLKSDPDVREVNSNHPASSPGITSVSGFLDPATMLRYAGPPGPPCRAVA